ncbi:TraU family protein [Psychromonas sp. KJ10-2]|uniref:TraU family protein n=1 Tax=Psychromonas sp. KJ10-2 TaxID=3391822 RepID=UPI0039B6DAB9
MMSLGGAEMNMTDGRQRGTTGANEQQGGAQAAFWHYHYFAYPLLMMLEMLSPNRCGDGYLSMDLLYFSEVDPTWSDEELAFFANPESVIFGNPISVAACLADGAAATVGKPINSLFWCAGAWGGMYPFSGYATGKVHLQLKPVYLQLAL